MCKKTVVKLKICLWVVFVLIFCLCVSAQALLPEEVLVVANRNAAKSEGLARYYMEKRQIPQQNLVLLFMTDKESCTREAYVKKAVPPIRRFLEKNTQIRAIVTIYGVPLRISSPGFTKDEQKVMELLNREKKTLERQLAENKIADSQIKEKKSKQLGAVKKKLSQHKLQWDKVASFDSELSLVKQEKYNLNLWQPNPFYLKNRNSKTPENQLNVLMTSRLDAANADVVKRIINDTLEAEQNGLKGVAYFDARWKKPDKPNKGGYGFYDQSLHRAAQILNKSGKIKVVVDDRGELFQKNQCPETALYCGWYSLAKYVDAFEWQKGSVGYHMASGECTTLKNEGSQVWCKKMLDNGIAATIGPVGEPYIQGFPVPEVFFGFLTQGSFTLAEAYLISLPYLSWKMVLVGDPLYRLNIKS